MKPQLIKGNEAIIKKRGAGRMPAYYGYPITPASEIAEAAAYYFPLTGGILFRPKAKWRRSTCSMARRRLESGR